MKWAVEARLLKIVKVVEYVIVWKLSVFTRALKNAFFFTKEVDQMNSSKEIFMLQYWNIQVHKTLFNWKIVLYFKNLPFEKL